MNSLKTIYSRITTMTEVEDILNDVGVAVRNQAQEVRPVQAILSDLAGQWHDLTDEERQNIAVKVAGRYQLSRFLAMMNGWETATKATQTALTSQGSAMRENEAYMESFEARINKLKNAFTDMALKIGDAFMNNAMMGIIDLLESMAVGVGNLVDKFGALPTVMLGLTPLLGIFGVFTKISEGIRNTIAGVGAFRAGYINALNGIEGSSRKMSTGVVGGWNAITKAENGAKLGALAFGRAVKGLAISTGIGAIFVGISWAIEKLVGKYQEQKQAQKELEESNDALVESFRNTEGGLEALVNEHEKLSKGALKEGTEEYNEYLRVNQELAEAMPNMVDYIDSKGVAHMKDSEAMRENAKYAEELSEKYAKLQQQTFAEDLEERANAIEKLTEKMEKSQKKIDKLEAKDGKNKFFGGKHDMGAKIEQERIQILSFQQEVQGQIQGMNSLISETSIASLEAGKKMKYMTDTGIDTIERIQRNNEKSLMNIAKNVSSKSQQEALIKQANELAEVSERVAHMIADKSKELVDSAIDKGLNEEQIQSIKSNFDTLLDAMPDEFLTVDSLKNLDLFEERLEGITKISSKIQDGAGSLEGLTKDFQKLGFTQEEAEKMTIKLGYAFDNQAIKAEALAKQEMGELNESLDEYIELTIEAVDVTDELFGFSSGDTSALKTNLEMLKALKQMGYEGTEVWKQNISDIANYFGTTNEYVEKNLSKFEELSRLMSNWTIEFDEKGNLTKEVEKDFKKIQKLAKELDVEIKIDAEYKELEAQTKAVDKNSDAKKKNAEMNKKLESSLKEVNEKFKSFTENSSKESKNEWLFSVIEGLNKLEGQIDVVKDDKLGGLKLVLEDGSNSEFLSAISRQMNESGGQIEQVTDDAGNMFAVFKSDTGESWRLSEINGELEKASDKTKDAKESADDLSKTIENLAKSYEKFAKSGSSDDRDNWILHMSEQLHKLGDDLDIVKDEKLGGFKLALADGGESELLNTINEQLAGMDGEITTTTDKYGNLIAVFQDETGVIELGKIEEGAEKVGNEVEKTKDKTKELKEETERATEKFDEFIKSGSNEARNEWLAGLQEDLTKFGDDLTVVKDEKLGGFKLELSDGSRSQLLDTVNSQIDDTGGKITLVKDDAGNLNAVFSDDVGTYYLSGVNKNVGDLETNLENATEKQETFKNKLDGLSQFKPIDFLTKFIGLNSTAKKIGTIEKAMSDLWVEIGKLKDLSGIFDSLKDVLLSIEDSVKSVADKSKGTFDDLTTQAGKAKKKVEEVETSIASLNKKLRNLPLDGFANLGSSASGAIASIEGLKASLSGISGRLTAISGASMLYSASLQSVSSSTGGAVGLITQYMMALARLREQLVMASFASQTLVGAQNVLSHSMISTMNVITMFNVTMVNMGSTTVQTFMRMAMSVTLYTANIIKSHTSHMMSLAMLERVNSQTWTSIANTINSRGNESVRAVKRIADEMSSAFRKGMNDIKGMAEQIPSLIGQGIRTHMSSATSAMDAVARDMVKRFKKELGIHSPSRVFEELGGWVIQGLSNGLTGSDLKSLGQEVFSDFGGGAISSWQDMKDFIEFGGAGMNPNFGGSFTKTSNFGMRKNPVSGIYKLHAGTDYGAPMGTPIKAQAGGIVSRSAYVGGYGNMVEIKGAGGMSYIYAHNSRNIAKVGDKVSAGQMIGLVGSTGNSTGPHVHYEVRKNGVPINVRGRFANGGFINHRMIAEVGEEGREAIIPLVPKRRERGLDLWEETGQMLGIDPNIIDMLLPRKRSGQGSSGEGGFGFGAMTASAGGEGGSSVGGGGSGTSGVIQPTVYAGGTNMDGQYDITAFASKKTTSSSKKSSSSSKKKVELESLFKVDLVQRQADAYNHAISMVETKMSAMTENTLKYRNALKQVVFESNKLMSTEKKQLNSAKKRQKSIEKQIKALGKTSSHTEKQRKKYNSLQQEYENNISKIQNLEKSIESTSQKIKNTNAEIFTDWIDQIVGKYDTAIEKMKKKVEKIDFQLEVLGFTDPDNAKKELDLLAKKTNEIQKQEASTRNLESKLQKEYDKAVKKYGKSSKEAKKVKEELDKTKDSLDGLTLEVLRAEKAIEDKRGEVADKGINQLKEYYKNMKDMAVKAIELEKRELEKAHKSKMEMYDKEIEKINSVYDEKLKTMDKEKRDTEYQEQLDERNSKKTELMNKISLLSRDTSLEGRKKVEEARKELEELNKEISSMMKERQDELLREAIEKQKEEQIEKIEKEKETETESYESQVEELDKESDEISKHYDDMLNDEKHWADMREGFIKGSFSSLTKELEDMSKKLANMTKGNFGKLTTGFSGFSDELKKEFAEIFDVDLGNLNFSNEGLLDEVKGAQKSKYGVYMGDGVDYKDPSMTTGKNTSNADIYDAKAPTSSGSTSSTSKAKPIKVGGKAKVTTKNANAYMDSYGKQVKPWATQAKYAGVGVSDSLYVVNTRGNYVALAKNNNINDAIAWVKKNDVVGLRTGGYTGDWAGDEGRLAMLHKKELVLNERQTSDILDSAKIMDKVKSIIPNVSRGGIFDKVATAGQITNITYGDINVTVEDGDKKKGKDIATEIMKGMKKKGR